VCAGIAVAAPRRLKNHLVAVATLASFANNGPMQYPG
jgi:hypothetical protein